MAIEFKWFKQEFCTGQKFRTWLMSWPRGTNVAHFFFERDRMTWPIDGFFRKKWREMSSGTRTWFKDIFSLSPLVLVDMPFVVDDIPTLAARYGSPISNLNTSDPDNPGPLIKRQDPIYGLPGRLELCSNIILRHAPIPAQGQCFGISQTTNPKP